MEGVLIIGAPLALVAFVIWLAKRDRRTGQAFGDQEGQSSIITGAEVNIPRILPVEPLEGPTVNGALVDEMNHHGSPESTDKSND